MPKVAAKKGKSKQESDDSPDISPELSEDETVEKIERKPNNVKRTGNKRNYHEMISKSGGGDCAIENNANIDYGNDLQKMLDMFRTDVNRTQQARKCRLEQYTAGAMKANESKLREMVQYQLDERKHLHQEMQRNVGAVLDQWSADLTRAKDQEEKMMKIVQQQMKMIQQNRTMQLQRMSSLRQIHESYNKSFQEQEVKSNEQCNNMELELRRELNELQKKMMLESQKEEMAHMQKSLQGMLFM